VIDNIEINYEYTSGDDACKAAEVVLDKEQTNRGAQNMKHRYYVRVLIVKVAEVMLQKQADW